MLKQQNWKFLIATLGGFLTFYFLFWALIICLSISPKLLTVRNIAIDIVFTTNDGLCQFPLALLVGFPLFLLGLMICDRLTSRFYLSVVCHALLAVPLSGLVLASPDFGMPHIMQDWHDIVGLAARWLEASLPSGAMGGFTGWALRPPSSRERI